MSTYEVVLLPGAVLPAELAYAGLVDLLGVEVATIVKDLEVYREDVPPAGYSLDTEIEGALREADARGGPAFTWSATPGVALRRWPAPPRTRRDC